MSLGCNRVVHDWYGLILIPHIPSSSLAAVTSTPTSVPLALRLIRLSDPSNGIIITRFLLSGNFIPNLLHLYFFSSSHLICGGSWGIEGADWVVHICVRGSCWVCVHGEILG